MRIPAPSLVAILAVALAPVLSEAQTERASVASTGAEADAPSSRPAVSGDGRIVVFASDATNLVPNDLNGTTDVFVRDRATRTTVRIGLDPSGGEGNDASAEPAISRDGRFVVFSSLATTLVPGDTNGSSDVFLHDRVLGRTTRVSTDSTGAQADGPCFDPTISADGLFVAFVSGATNLAGGAGAQGGVFLKDLTTGSTTLVVGGIFFLSTWVRPSVSDGGGLVAATHVDIGPVFTFAALFDVRNGTLIPVDVSPSGQPGDGQSGGIRVSADGSLAVFHSDSSNLVPQGTTFFRSQVYARDLRLGVTTLLSAGVDGSEGSDISYAPAISVDGSTVAFESWATNLVAGDANGTPDVFVRRLAAGETLRTSVGSSGSEAAGTSSEAAVSADGRYAVFTSDAPDLVAGDANATIDVFVRDLGTIGLDSVAPASGSEAGGDVANLFGTEFTTRADTTVAIGGAPATVLYVASGVIVVRTPPGSGRADVEVRNSNGRAVLAAAYEYLDPALAARRGSVNARFGEREDVLFVNSSAGDARRELVVAVGAPVDVAMRAPSTRPSARFALYARLGAPGPAPVAQPFGLGFAVFPTPLNAGAPPPAVIWNNVIGAGASRLGAPDRPSSPAPTTVLRRNAGSSRAVDLTLQGFIRDGGSPNRHELSPTNAIVVRFR